MKEKLAHNYRRGFSTLEIVIALALMIVVIVGAVNANIASQYWSITSETSNEALYKAKTLIEELRASSAGDFQSASSSLLGKSENPSEPADASCIDGGLCYFVKKNITDISSCSKYAEGYVEWRIALRYPTTTESLYTNLTNNNEIVALGGDCALNVPGGNWTTPPSAVGSNSWTAQYATGIDVLQGKIYITSSTTPQLRIFKVPTGVGTNPTLVGSTSHNNWRLNALDVMRDPSTGRTYAFAMQHASTTQLAVFDVTDATDPTFVTQRSLNNVSMTGTSPEGWRVFVYGGRLYVTTRYTATDELHIFNINSPVQPSEVLAGSTMLQRTVNDMIVREQIVGGTTHRYLFLAASASLKELTIFDVTDDIPSDEISLDLPGSENALSLFLTGNRLYIGRQQKAGGPELYVFDVLELLKGNTTPLGTAEVNADVNTIRGAGKLLFLGTSKLNEQFQVWNSDYTTWSPTVVNVGRLSASSMPNLAPLGIDLSQDWVYLLSQYSIGSPQPEILKIMYTTP